MKTAQYTYKGMIRIAENYDVVVCGGGLAGVVCAIAAARAERSMGCRVVLIEERPVLGGNSSSLAGVPPHGATAMGHNRNAREGGILEELRMRYAQVSPNADDRRFWDFCLAEACKNESNLTVHFNTKIIDVESSDGLIHSVTAIQTSTEKIFNISGRQFIEATGDSFVAKTAGAEVLMGREGKSEFGEIYAQEHPDGKTLGSTIYFTAHKRVEEKLFVPPVGSAQYTCCSDLKGRDHSLTTLLRGNLLSPDGDSFRAFWWLELGGERNVVHDAEEIYQDLTAEMFGVWDHLKNHCTPEMKEALRYFDLTSWSMIPLKRGSRRVIGAQILTEEDLFNPKKFPDRVGCGGFPIDLHPPEGIRSPEAPCTQIFLHDLYSVPYRCMFSRNIKNLSLAGRSISATHVALGSLRVMNTLAALGQATGTAAAWCAVQKINPEDLSVLMIDKLQQRLLRDDLFIIETKNEDPNDLAQNAVPSATTSMPIRSLKQDGFISLFTDFAQSFPVPQGEIKKISVYLENDSARPANVPWKISIGNKLDSPENCSIKASGILSVPAGFNGWINLDFQNLFIERYSILWIQISAFPGIKWAYQNEEVFGSRFAVIGSNENETDDFHGRAMLAPQKNSWISPNHHGRLSVTLANLLHKHMTTSWPAKPSMAKKPYITLCTKFDPSVYPYGAENVINGISRATDFPNIWISEDNSFPQEIVLSFPQVYRIQSIHLTFDTCLDSDDRMYGFPKSDFCFSYPVHECISDYSVMALSSNQAGNNSWVELFSINGNSKRHCIHSLEQPIFTDKIMVKVKATNGASSARIFEIRVY
jgi:hypothetical protein